MNNIQNGGLICKLDGDMIWGNVSKSIQVDDLHIMPWFMNYRESEKKIYYSNALKDNYLCKLDLSGSGEEILLNEPVYLLTQYENRFYYINEKNSYLYCYEIQEKRVKQVTDEAVGTFHIKGENLWYSNHRGIMHATLDGQSKERISKQEATQLVSNQDTLFFIDKEDHTVCYLSQKELQRIEDSKATSINVYEDCIFYNHASDKSHIYRYSMNNEFNIKFIPERADYIHIIDDTIYYFNQDNRLWMRVPVHGGKPLSLTE